MLFDALYPLLCLSMLLKFWDQSFLSDMHLAHKMLPKKNLISWSSLSVVDTILNNNFYILVFDLLCTWLLGFRWPSCKWFLSTPGGTFRCWQLPFLPVGKVLLNFREGLMIILFNKSPIPAKKRNIICQTLLEGAILVPKNTVFHFWSDSFSTKMSVLPLCNNGSYAQFTPPDSEDCPWQMYDFNVRNSFQSWFWNLTKVHIFVCERVMINVVGSI